MPEDTCFKDCRYYNDRHKCPNYVKTTWQDSEGNVKTVHDCIPRRSFNIQMVQDAQLLATRQEIARIQDEVSHLVKSLEAFLVSFKAIAEEKSKKKTVLQILTGYIEKK